MKKNKNFLLHTPVLLDEVTNFLSLNKNHLYLDGTFGDGGHSKAILEKNKNCKVIAIDRDPDVLEIGKVFKKKYNERFKLILGRISNLEKILNKENITKVNGVLFDLGVSTRQIRDSDRGFSFQKNGPLDMRMEKKGITAADFLDAQRNVNKLSNIIFSFGEEKKSRKIAKAIIEYKKNKKIKTTKELANIIMSVKRLKNKKINPCTKTFQAIRIYINNELDEIQKGLIATKNILVKGGRMVVISFHSLEDRIIKDFLYKHSGKIYNKSRYLPQETPNINSRPSFKILTKKVVRPKIKEIRSNFYSRSAKLRAAERL
tara:strand:- start:322 stop:1272 length:951 start_codon:yes stop_codon:yes gene_type:complete